MTRILLAFMLILTGYAGGFAQAVDFKQASNNDLTTLGQVFWINGINNQSKSVYYEGMAVPQRIILTNLDATKPHVFYFSLQSIKKAGNTHAYDFITSWDKAKAVADYVGSILPANTSLLSDLEGKACGDAIPNDLVAVCAAASNPYRVEIPAPNNSLVPNPNSSDIAPKKAAFEAAFGGDARMLIKANAVITEATLTFEGYSGNDQDATFKLVWTAAGATTTVIQFAGHLALGSEPSGKWAGIGHGTNFGAGAVSGAPYHVTLGRVDNVSLGNQDNQIKAPLILGCTPPTASVGADQAICAGSTVNVVGDFGGGAFIASWSTSGTGTFDNENSKAAVYTPSAADISAGSVILTYTTDKPGDCGAASDELLVTINPLPTVSVNTPAAICAGGSTTIMATPGSVGTYSYSWTVPQGASAPGDVASFSASVAGTYSVVITNTSTTCISASASGVLTVNPTPAKPTVNIVASTCASNGSASIGTYSGLTFTFSPAGPSVDGSGNITGITYGTSYTVTATNSDNCTSVSSDAFIVAAMLPTPAKPTVNIVSSTCASNGSASIGTYSGLTFNFTPSGPSVDGSGNITGAVYGRSYAVTATNGDNCTSVYSDPFVVAGMLPTPAKPTVNIVASTCANNGSASIGTYSGLTFTFSPAGPSVDGSGNITGVTYGTSYTITATNSDNCTSVSSDPFIVAVILPTPGVPEVKVVDNCNGTSTLSTNATGTLLWSTNETTSSITVSSASTYTVTQTVNGCMSDAGSGVAAPKQNPTFTLTPTASPCLGAPEGKILVTSTSGNDFKVILGTGSEVNVTGGTYIFNNLFGKKVYTVTVKQNGCEATKDVTVNDGTEVCYPFYTYSQGYYGNTNGKGVACIRGEGGLRTRQFIERSLVAGGGLKLGVAGSAKFFSVPNNGTALENASAIDKLLLIMPGGGSPNVLTGSSILPSVASAQLKNGKINNVLLGQAVAMWLNINIPYNELGAFDLKGLKCKTTIVTKEPSSASSCNYPYAGTTEVSTAFPQTVVTAMIKRGKTTVKDLVDFASEMLGLASGKTIGGVSLSDMNSALDAIVTAFHGGKYFARFDGSIPGCNPPTTSNINVPSPVEEAAAVKVEASNAAVVVSAFPNPYIDQVTFNVTVKNAGKGSLVIYNMLGQKVTNLFEGNMQANSTQTIRYSVPFAQRKNLVYVFRQNETISTGKLVSGK